mmetsp:Transcript_29469/g.69698  ORF Transcript_29469/g.69698 Transcript_29469/m.69698 type:complete len:153 (-) Transcript_29469:133-591(-)
MAAALLPVVVPHVYSRDLATSLPPDAALTEEAELAREEAEFAAEVNSLRLAAAPPPIGWNKRRDGSLMPPSAAAPGDAGEEEGEDASETETSESGLESSEPDDVLSDEDGDGEVEEGSDDMMEESGILMAAPSDEEFSADVSGEVSMSGLTP